MSLILAFVVGYAACVVFPIPWLNRFVLDLWTRILTTKQTTSGSKQTTTDMTGTSSPTGPTGPVPTMPITGNGPSIGRFGPTSAGY